ncbi:MAG: hypothetical protein A2Z99_20470 [Treponema sp. GWB1_62_6]|nr:MAG: hypothetical protein A2Z99_20470 [Treponema sp. GWB1_62_6]OHE66514.1 MAG: hypothetical protein A2Y36_16605 [Treponema sp. GWA1_62_8]OHE74544.1 MAG: hypothetical protein A2413_01860 [Treponema sp. RIFOXYC1_FULL_61_9]
MKTEAVIFDMDGVLTDSEWFIAEAGRLMFKENHGVDVTHADFLPFVGHGEDRFLGGVAAKHAVSSFDLARDKARTYELYEGLARGKLRELPGASAFVRSCRALGLRTALATSTDRVKMLVNLREIGLADGAFDALVNGQDVERKKPFPDIFLEAARRIGVRPGNCWVVEDSVGGVTAAVAAGMRCMALLTTFPEDALRAAGAALIVRDLATAEVARLV